MSQGELLTREDLRRRGWSKLMLKTLLPTPDLERDGGQKLPTPLWASATIAELEAKPDIDERLRATLQEREAGAANTARQKAGQLQKEIQVGGRGKSGDCDCATAQMLADALMHRWAYDLALVCANGDSQVAHAALGRVDLDLERPGRSLALAVKEATAMRREATTETRR